MNIAKALKVKNRLVGELNRLQEIFKRENSKRDDNPSQVKAEDAYNDVLNAFEKVVEIKGAINKATAGISDKLAALAEYKQYLNFIRGVPTREGIEETSLGYSQTIRAYVWTAYLNRKSLDEKILHYQKKVDELQDEIDEYNTKTQVDFTE